MPNSIETLEVTCERKAAVKEGDPRGGFGIAVEDRNGEAWIGYTVDPAKEADVVRKGDKITHVGGKGPLGTKEVCEALKAAPEKATMKIVRGEKPPRQKTTFVGAMLSFSTVMLIGAVGWQALELPPASTVVREMDTALGMEGAWSQQFDGVVASMQKTYDEAMAKMDAATQNAEAAAAASRKEAAPAKQQPSGPALTLNGVTYRLLPDGSTDDVKGLRRSMRADKGFMDSLRENDAGWARIVAGGADGSFDEEAFQERLRKNFGEYEKAQAFKLNEDGSPVDPAKYLAAARKEKKWLKMIKTLPEEDQKAILGGDTEKLSEMLRHAKRKQNGETMPEPPPPPPNPVTPYDDVGDVGMSFRILTDEGEEKDLYSLAPKQSDEEKHILPPHLKCQACQASAHQGALAMAEALRTRYKEDLVSVTALDAMTSLCDNAGKWTADYGLQPGKKGVNLLQGPGITARRDEAMEGNQELMLQTAHSNDLGRQLGEVRCRPSFHALPCPSMTSDGSSAR